MDHGHRITELRSIALHRLVAERLDDELLATARRRVDRSILDGGPVAPLWAESWREILSRPPPEIARLLTEDTELFFGRGPLVERLGTELEAAHLVEDFAEPHQGRHAGDERKAGATRAAGRRPRRCGARMGERGRAQADLVSPSAMLPSTSRRVIPYLGGETDIIVSRARSSSALTSP